MCLLIESIRISRGKVLNINLHQARYEKSLAFYYPKAKPNNLLYEIKKNKIPSNQHIKCRILYSDTIQKITFEAYQYREINTIKIIENNEITYPHKLANREQLDQLFLQKSSCDEIVIVKNGFVTDAYYFNIVLEKDNGYFTPQNPLLSGVQRQYLVNKSIIIPQNIHVTEVQNYKKIHLINAMTPLNTITLPISNIIY